MSIMMTACVDAIFYVFKKHLFETQVCVLKQGEATVTQIPKVYLVENYMCGNQNSQKNSKYRL